MPVNTIITQRPPSILLGHTTGSRVIVRSGAPTRDLNSLTDVRSFQPAQNDLLVFNSATGLYENQSLSFLTFKNPARVATTGDLVAVADTINKTLVNSGVLGPLTIDGIALVVGDRILVKDQANPVQNGLYTATILGSGTEPWIITRATDFDEAGETEAGTMVMIEEGAAWADTGFILKSDNPLSPDTSAIEWKLVFGVGSTVLPGTGLSLTSNVLDVQTDGITIYIDGNSDVAVKSSITSGQVLNSDGAGGTAVWGALDLSNTNAVTGVLPAVNGGLGSIPLGALAVGTGTSGAAVDTGTALIWDVSTQKFIFGGDTSLFRSGPGTLQTDGDMNITGEINLTGHLVQDKTTFHYWGPVNVDTSWRFGLVADEFVIQKRVLGVWVTQFSFDDA